MKYIFFKAKQGNFGDDLNPWLWPKIFGENISNSGKCFFGIGSILKNNSSLITQCAGNDKIVFGSGIRPSNNYSKFSVDKTWDIKFLRGPLSAHELNNKYEYITDGAYAIRQLNNFGEYQNIDKKYEISVMPYFHSLEYFDWKDICDKLGYHYISPLSENGVEFTIREIAASKKIITEAMHGAIVADILRVPWHRLVLTTPFTEGERVADFKWSDWLQSIDIYNIDVSYVPFFQKIPSKYRLIHSLLPKSIFIQLLSLKKVKSALIKNLKQTKNYYNSTTEKVNDIDNKITAKIQILKHECSKSVPM